jgi:TRAP-type C4-dicarboxylate transport system permease small subunit
MQAADVLDTGATSSPASPSLVLARQRHLKWAALDRLEYGLMVVCGLTLLVFSTSVLFDILTRIAGRPWLWLQEVTSTFFIYGIFIGTAAATRRNDHLFLTAIADALHGKPKLVVQAVIQLVMIAVAAMMIYFGYVNFLRGFESFRMPSMTPIASLYAAIPLSGILVALFAIEQLVNGLMHGFDPPPSPEAAEPPGRDIPPPPAGVAL